QQTQTDGKQQCRHHKQKRRIMAAMFYKRPGQQTWLQVLVSCLVLVYGYLACLVFVPAAEQQSESWRARQSAVAVVLMVLSLYCLWKATLTHPGRVRVGWNGTNQDPRDASLSWCNACQLWKPPRAHHCSHCNCCVARYDHHCDWIDNCVGQANHKYFALFLFYQTVCITHHFFMLYCYLSTTPGRPVVDIPPEAHRHTGRMLQHSARASAAYTTMFAIAYSMVAFGFWIFACAFLGCTFQNLATNTTTYDQHAWSSTETDHTYTRGLVHNFCEVLGDHPLLWLIPVERPVVMDGYSVTPEETQWKTD
ncbi:Palmitoyltransferase pfa3, partial [Diplonema papillatum]